MFFLNITFSLITFYLPKLKKNGNLFVELMQFESGL